MEAFEQRGDEGFWEMHDLLFARQQALERENIDAIAAAVGLDMRRYRRAMDQHAHRATIEEDAALAARVGARGTPNSFINGIQVTGTRPDAAFREVIDRELTHAREVRRRQRIPARRVYEHLMRTAAPEAVQAPPSAGAARPPRPRPDPNAVYRVPLQGDEPIRGPQDALVTIVEFSDFQCPFCRRVQPTLDAIRARLPEGSARGAYEQPLPFHRELSRPRTPRSRRFASAARPLSGRCMISSSRTNATSRWARSRRWPPSSI